jgi:hypothetical protein
MLGLDVAAVAERMFVIAGEGLTASVPGVGLWKEFSDLAEKDVVGAWFFDSRARVFGTLGDSNDERAQAGVGAIISGFISDSNAPVFVVSHTRKSGSNSIEDISGSMQRGAGADNILMVSAKYENHCIVKSEVVFAKLRDGCGAHPQPISFSISKASVPWVLDDGRQPDRPLTLQERIYEFLEKGGWRTVTEIRDAVKVSTDDADAVLTHSVNIGIVVTALRKGRNGRSTKMYSIKSKNTSK